jgi:hypothetical protein
LVPARIDKCHDPTRDKKLLKLLSVVSSVTNDQPAWTCPSCGKQSPIDQPICVWCKVPRPNDSRSRLASFANVLDTRSFILPVRRRLVWIWVAITLGLPMVLSAVYYLVKHYLQ